MGIARKGSLTLSTLTSFSDTTQALGLGLAKPFVWGYGLLACLLLLGNWCKVEKDVHGG